MIPDRCIVDCRLSPTRSLEIPQASASTEENASSGSNVNSIGVTDASSVTASPERTGGDEEIDTVKQGHETDSIAPIYESAMLAQSVPTVCIDLRANAPPSNTDVARSRPPICITLRTTRDRTRMNRPSQLYMRHRVLETL